MNCPLPRIKRHYLTIHSQSSNCLMIKFETRRIECLFIKQFDIWPSTVIYFLLILTRGQFKGSIFHVRFYSPCKNVWYTSHYCGLRSIAKIFIIVEVCIFFHKWIAAVLSICCFLSRLSWSKLKKRNMWHTGHFCGLRAIAKIIVEVCIFFFNGLLLS